MTHTAQYVRKCLKYKSGNLSNDSLFWRLDFVAKRVSRPPLPSSFRGTPTHTAHGCLQLVLGTHFQAKLNFKSSKRLQFAQQFETKVATMPPFDSSREKESFPASVTENIARHFHLIHAAVICSMTIQHSATYAKKIAQLLSQRATTHHIGHWLQKKHTCDTTSRRGNTR